MSCRCWWVVSGVLAWAVLLIPAVLCAQEATTVVSNTAEISSCRQITATTILTGDEDDDGYTRFEFNTTNAWPGTISCDKVTGASARQCLVVGLSPSATYFVRATTFDESDPVDGVTQQVLGGFSLPSCTSDQVAPTVLVLSPVRSGIVGGLDRVKVRVYDQGGLQPSEPVQWSVDGGAWAAATVNSSYGCGSQCEVFEFDLDTVGLALGNGRHYLDIRATDAAGNIARLAWPIRIFNVGVAPGGAGTLLRRTYGSQLCIDCHDLETHSSQPTSTQKGNWAFGCSRCHTPHKTRNIFLVRETLRSPSSGKVDVVFHRDDDGGSHDSYLGDHSQPDNAPYTDGICEVCHTRTLHYRNDDSGGDHNHKAGGRCVSCHWHEQGFKGEGSGKGHLTHISGVIGPHMTCASGDAGCHGAEAPPLLSDGLDLSGTSVCDPCHSPEGTYDGVNDPVSGAKANWAGGVYSGGALATGKERWCAGCHDEGSSNAQGVEAPNVIGDEDGSYPYGTGWGFYKTGHGLQADENYPSKGGIETLAGRPMECGSCHDVSAAHIDGDARTFDCIDRVVCAPTINYGTSYRLKTVGGEAPMVVPRLVNNSADTFRLCAQCHDSGPLTDSGNFDTNLATWSSNSYINRHAYHLNSGWFMYPADYVFEYDPSLIRNSRVTCVTCHNVHGSTRLAMIRDGKLIGRDPGLEIWYGNSDVSHFALGSEVPQPDNLPLSASQGTIWRSSSAGNVCGGCHGGGMVAEYRCVADGGNGNTPCVSPYLPPFQLGAALPPTLEWTGENGYESDGVEPGNSSAGAIFSFRVKYTDLNNDAPSTIELWIDKDDDGIYENFDGDPADEKIDMVGVDPRDVSYWDGKLYLVDLPLSKAGDNSFIYRFSAVGGGDSVELPSGSDLTVSVSNNRPVLSWSGDSYFEADGVHP
ncbi:MAG: hypothetical protein ABFS37_12220, partial [Acidobacteriota bacterium]